MSDSKHTPIPWRVVDRGDSFAILANSNYPMIFLNAGEEDTEANAAFIVEACNNYEAVKAQRDDLADALKVILGQLKIYRGHSMGIPQKEYTYNPEEQQAYAALKDAGR